MQKWLTEEMQTGNQQIDNQHRDLLHKADDLIQACKALRGEEEIGRLFWFLKRYVRKHFRDEEALQLACGFPGYTFHKAQHEWFYREVQRLEGRYAKEGATTLVVVGAIRMMQSWLRNHFLKMDRLLVEHLRERGMSPEK
jgi:hemerythrin